MDDKIAATTYCMCYLKLQQITNSRYLHEFVQFKFAKKKVPKSPSAAPIVNIYQSIDKISINQLKMVSLSDFYTQSPITDGMN